MAALELRGLASVSGLHTHPMATSFIHRFVGRMSMGTAVWKSESNLEELGLSFYHVASRTELKSSGWVASASIR